jgi:hypothetical protein
MINTTYQPVASSALVTRSILLFLLTFVMLASMLVDDASARTRSRTVGGTTTDLHHHGITLKCTWEEFQGVWDSVADYTNSPPEISVSHSVGDPGDAYNHDYAICGGWKLGTAPSGSLTNPDGTPNLTVLEPDENDEGGAQHGWGYFYYNATYTSKNATTCIEDPNSGIGNNCVKFTDNDNKKHGGGDPVPTSGATLACADNTPGTKLTFQFNCADGVDTSGFVTLVPNPNEAELQIAPDFTGPCSRERVAAGKCTMQIGGVPTKTVKIKGQSVTVVDTNACLETFPEAYIPNALGSGQTQLLAAGAILYYEETAYDGFCDPNNNNLPTLDGAPTAAFGRKCTSDMEPFPTDMTETEVGNYFPNDPLEVDGFDNELRVCYKESKNDTAHTNVHDVETVELANITVDAGPTFNLNCTTGGNTDSGKYKVLISDQAALLAGNVDVTPLSDAPTLEGVSPIKAEINTDDFGVQTLVLTYPTCVELTANIIANNDLGSEDNNTNVTLELTGQTEPTTTSLDQTIKALIEVKVNGL